MTLDRIVSLQDYEDFARAFAGIAKSRADWAWSGQTRGVLITVAGPDGAAIDEDSTIHGNLVAAIQQSSDAQVPVRVQSYRNALFSLSATIVIDPDYAVDLVLAAVEAALRSQFGFDARDFAQPVALSAVTAAIQAVRGVIGVNVDRVRAARRCRRRGARLGIAGGGLSDQRGRRRPRRPSCSPWIRDHYS